MIDRMRATPPDDPFKKGKADEMDDENKRIEKTREVDPEKEKKFKKYIKEKEKAEKEEDSKKYTPYESKFHETSPYEKKKIDKQKIDEKKEADLIPPSEGKPSYEAATEPQKKVQVDKPLSPQHPKEDAKEVKSTAPLPSKPEERIEQQRFKKSDRDISSPSFKEEEEREKEKKSEVKTISIPLDLPPDIAGRVLEITSDLNVYLNPEIAPLFEQMVGKMIVMSTREGIMQTEVELTSESFQNSVFYGSKIIIEKYATAPDSFNIQLTGTPEAVAIFNAHLNPLMESFRRTDLNFRIGRLEAVYETEKPLFKRKKPPTNQGGESKSFH